MARAGKVAQNQKQSKLEAKEKKKGSHPTESKGLDSGQDMVVNITSKPQHTIILSCLVAVLTS